MNKAKSVAMPKSMDVFCCENEGIFIKQRDYYRKFLYADIVWVEASGNYCVIHLSNRSPLTIIKSISSLAKILPVRLFLRIHRSYIVNIHLVDSIIGNTLCVGTHHLSVSAPYRLEVFRCFTILDTINE